MSFGIQTWNNLGTLLISPDSRITRAVSRFNIALTIRGTVSIVVPGYTDDGTWAFFTDDYGAVRKSVSGSTFTFTELLGKDTALVLIVFRY